MTAKEYLEQLPDMSIRIAAIQRQINDCKSKATDTATHTIRAVRYIPGMAPHQIEIENALESLQSAVGGDIETITLKRDLVLICDEEGKMKHRITNFDATALLVRNYPHCKDHIAGVALLVGAGADGEFTNWDHGGMPPFILDVG